MAHTEDPSRTRTNSGTAGDATLLAVSPSTLAGPDATPGAGSLAFGTVVPRPGPASRLVTWSHWNGAQAERFRLLAARVLTCAQRAPLPQHFLVCTSSVSGEGKTVAAANFALALARTTESRVLLVDGDLRQPSMEALWHLPRLAGLSDWIGGLSNGALTAAAGEDAPISRFIYQVAGVNLYLLPAGQAAVHPLEWLRSERAAELGTVLAGWFDWILVDAPPLLPLADAQAWMRLADGWFMVVREGFSKQAMLVRALRGLDRSRLLGVIVNQSREARRECRRYAPPRVHASHRLPAW